ncbi:MAG TPA: CapA family protein [Candidatus Saccharimonadales bacterium]|nr:CapA family protein [Candidatus Saccharimonadales bacterium]
MPPVVSIPQNTQPRRLRVRIIVAILLLLIAAIGLWWLTRSSTTKSSHVITTTTTQQKVASATNIRLIATGDWIAHDAVNAAAKQPDGTYNYLPLVSDFIPVFKQADIRFCNDPILNGGESLGISGYPKFNSPTEFVKDMGKLGCNLANTASNHSFDYTQANINNSVAAWQQVPNMLAVAGENQNQQQHDAIHIFTVKGVEIAFLAYTTYSNTDAPPLNNYGVNIFSQSFASSQIQQAKQQGAQFIIVSMRWGTEYSTRVDPDQHQDAQWLADQGVNLILGHGSHELQSVQQLKGADGQSTTVWYSLGNFLNTQELPETLFNGLAVIDINTQSKQITAMHYLPIYMHYEWTAAQQAADDINARGHLHLYLLEDATQSMIDAQQLHTSIVAQRHRMTSTLSANGLDIPLINSHQLYSERP